jgi:hypothetical protein
MEIAIWGIGEGWEDNDRVQGIFFCSKVLRIPRCVTNRIAEL